jgi:TonB family protein
MKLPAFLAISLLLASCASQTNGVAPAPHATRAIAIPHTAAEIESAKNAYNSVPLLLERVEAIFPAGSVGSLADGEAVIEFFVERDGTVGDTRVVSATRAAFGKAAIDCIKQWRFIAGNYHGKPARTRLEQAVFFEER